MVVKKKAVKKHSTAKAPPKSEPVPQPTPQPAPVEIPEKCWVERCTSVAPCTKHGSKPQGV